MILSKSKNKRNLLSVIGANFFVLFIGIIQSFVLPKLLSPNQYGIWELYLLYISYAGLFNIGVSDGIYLIYSGKSYDELDKSKFKAYFNIVVYLLTFLLVIWSLFQIIRNGENMLLMLLVGISSYLVCIINFTVMIDQATSRFAIYSKGHIIEKLVIMLGSLFLFKWRGAVVVICASIIGKLITAIYYYSQTMPILSSVHAPYTSVLQDIRSFCFAGIWVTLAAIGTTSMTGIGRFFVKSALGVTELGYYSFVLSLSGLFTILFSAIATVLFPMMRQNSREEYQKQIMLMDDFLDLVGLLILLAYLPARFLLGIWYSKYEPAFDCLIVLFPLVLLQGRTSMIHFTVYKVERFERQYVYNIFIAMLFCALFCMIGINMWPSITSIAIATYSSFVIWCILNTSIYNRISQNKLSYHLAYMLFTGAYIVINLMPGKRGIMLFISYAITILSIILLAKKQVPVLKDMREKTRKG